MESGIRRSAAAAPAAEHLYWKTLCLISIQDDAEGIWKIMANNRSFLFSLPIMGQVIYEWKTFKNTYFPLVRILSKIYLNKKEFLKLFGKYFTLVHDFPHLVFKIVVFSQSLLSVLFIHQSLKTAEKILVPRIFS